MGIYRNAQVHSTIPTYCFLYVPFTNPSFGISAIDLSSVILSKRAALNEGSSKTGSTQESHFVHHKLGGG